MRILSKLICIIFLQFALINFAYAAKLEVEISGISAELTKAVKNDLKISKAASETKLTNDRISNLYLLAESDIRSTLEALGYYNSYITSNLEQRNENSWLASFEVIAGDPVLISEVEIKVVGPAKDHKDIKKILQSKQPKLGMIALHKDYEDLKDKLIADISALGFLNVYFTTSELQINRDYNQAKIVLIINSGLRFKFGPVSFYGGLYADNLLKRYIPFNQGEPYEQKKLLELHKNLEDSDFFEKVRIDPLPNLSNPNDYIVPVAVRLVPRPRNRYTGSIGYGTDSGIRGSAGWIHKRLSAPGHKLGLTASASKILRKIKSTYTIPGKKAATDRYITSASVQEETIDERYSRKAELTVGKVIKRNNLESYYGISYFTETFRITSRDENLNKQYLLPTAKWSWLDEDNLRITLMARAGAISLGSATNVLQTEANAKKILPVNDETRFLIRATLGSTISKDFNMLPPSLRFFAGGDNTIRGYAYNTLGPKIDPNDIESEAIGGRWLVIGSLELERSIYKDFAAAIFVDSGNAMLSLNDPIAVSYGTGLRYKTPVGAFRVDLAKPTNRTSKKNWRIHVTFSTDL